MKIKIEYKFDRHNSPERMCVAVTRMIDGSYQKGESMELCAYAHDWKSAHVALIELVRIYLEKPKDEEIEIGGE